MSVFDIHNTVLDNTSTGTVSNGQTGSVDQVTELGSAKQIEQDNTPALQNATITQDGEKKHAIVLDGPLSNIYTQALNVVYAQGTNASVSQESQANDVTMLTAIMLQRDKDEIARQAREKNTDYVYTVTNTELEEDGLTHAFENVRTAVDMRCFRNVIVVMECEGVVKEAAALLDQYLTKSNVKMFYSRDRALRHLKG